MSYEGKRILEGAPNSRDLGGLNTADGRVLKKNRLIRSGMLRNLTDADAEYLGSVGLKTVVDLRTEREMSEKPDRMIDGVSYIHCPILAMKKDGITRETPETPDEEALRTIEMARRISAMNPDGSVQMRSLYPIMVSTEHALEHFREFFGILLDHTEGALLYHCTMGKDRVGTATALVLTALGVPREDIVSDYMITAERCAEGTERLVKSCRRFCDDEATLEFIRRLDSVEPDFIGAAFETIDALHGGMDAFLREKMGLDEIKLNRLKDLYLE